MSRYIVKEMRFSKKENFIYIYGIQNLVYVMDNSLDILEGDIL